MYAAPQQSANNQLTPHPARTQATRKALAGPHVSHPTLLYHPHHGHGGFLGDHNWQAQVLAAALGLPLESVQQLIASEAEEAAAAAEAARRSRRGVLGAARWAVGWTVRTAVKAAVVGLVVARVRGARGKGKGRRDGGRVEMARAE